MNDSIRLGSIRGIRIGAHWSVLVIAWLLGWGLSTRFLPEAVPGFGPVAYWAAGTGVAIAFFVSILAHELAHAAFALRAGIRVEGVTLWLLGGVAKLDGEAQRPADELRIAASGPVVSGLIGLGGLGLSAALGRLEAAPLLAESAAWLGRVNVTLALFNLLPGAPLDGGRIVRALAWWRGRDRLDASLAAVRLGRIIGFGMIGLGLGELLVGADVGGIWTVVLGVFLVTAAAAEGVQETTRSALDGVTVRQVMSASPTKVPGGITVDLFLDGVLAPAGAGAALVAEVGGEPTGIAGVAEVRRLNAKQRRERRVREIAVPLDGLPVVAPDEPLLQVFERLGSGTGPGVGSGYLLVREEGELIGLVTPSDLARSITARLAGVPARALRGQGS